MNLYDISCRYQQLLDQDELNAEECAELETLHGSVQDGIINRAKYIKNLEAEAAAITAAMKEMKARVDSLEAKTEKQRAKLAVYMYAVDMEKVKSPLFDVTVSKNRPSVQVVDEDAIPDYCWRVQEKVVRSLDKIHIKEVIESGTEVPGCVLIQNTKLEIK